MYFSYQPDLQYDTKPISYPFSESDFTITKNFFRRYKVDDNIFGYATFYKKYAVPEGYPDNPIYQIELMSSERFLNISELAETVEMAELLENYSLFLFLEILKNH